MPHVINGRSPKRWFTVSVLPRRRDSVKVVLEDEPHVAGSALQRRGAERADRVETVRAVRDVHGRPVSVESQFQLLNFHWQC